MSEHTPGPWHVGHDMQTIRCKSGDPVAYRTENPFPASVNAANAAFIVRAVNSHEALVEALETAAAQLDAAAEAVRAPHPSTANEQAAGIREWATTARARLASLQPETSGERE